MIKKCNLKSTLKRIISFMLIVVIMFGVLISDFSKDIVYADSNTIRKTMIQFYKGNSIHDIEGTDWQNPETLRFIALFLSNFYISNVTSFDGDDYNEENHKRVVDACVDALVKHCNYSEDTARIVVNAVYNYNLSSCKPLYAYTKTYKEVGSNGKPKGEVDCHNHSLILGGSGDKPVDEDKFWSDNGDATYVADSLMRVTWGNFIELGLQADNVDIWWANDDEDAKTRCTDATKRKEHTIWNWNYNGVGRGAFDGSTVKLEDKTISPKLTGDFDESDNPVYDGNYASYYCWRQFGKITNYGLATLGSYYLCANKLSYTYGYGNALLYAKDTKELAGLRFTENSVDDFKSDLYKICSLTAPLYVDWVGDIIVDTGFSRTVLVPACQNPWVWDNLQTGDSVARGKSINGITLNALSAASSSGNLKSLIAFSHADSGKTISNGTTNTSPSVGYGVVIDMGGKGDHTLWGNNVLHTYIGDKKYKLEGLDTRFALFKLFSTKKKSENTTTKVVQDMTDRLVGYDDFYKNDTPLKSESQWFDSYFGIANRLALATYSKTDNKYKVTSRFRAISDAEIMLAAVRNDDVDIKVNHVHNKVLDTGNLTPDFNTALIGGVYNNKKSYGGIYAFGTGVYYDSIGSKNSLVKFDTEKSSDNSIFSTANLYLGSNEAQAITSKFNKITKANEANLDIVTFNDTAADKYLTCIYLTYLCAYTNFTDNKSFDDKNYVDMKFCGDYLPEADASSVDWETIVAEAASDTSIQEEVMSFIYYFLHPSKGVAYLVSWVKAKIGGVLLSWHSDIVGGSHSNASTGMTHYLGFTGYTTLPDLYDIEFVAKLLDNYNSIIIFLIIIIALVLCCYMIVGTMTAQRALFGIIIFGIVAFLPPLAITATTEVCNNASTKILSNKFEYWAIVQHQTYLGELYQIASSKDANTYADLVLTYNSSNSKDNIAEESSQGYGGVKLKWMSPKKENYLATVANGLDSITSNDSLQTLIYGFMDSKISGQKFVDDANALYLYRDYTDITNYAMKSYNLYTTYNSGGDVGSNSSKYSSYDINISSSDNRKIGKWDENCESGNAKNGRFLIQYPSGLLVKDLVIRNNMKKTNTSDSLYPCSSIYALRSGFINKSVDISDSDLGNSNVNYYKAGDTNNLHLNFLLNFANSYSNYSQSYFRVKKLLDTAKSSDIKSEVKRLGEYGGADTSSKTWKAWGLNPRYFKFGQSNLSTEQSNIYYNASDSKDMKKMKYNNIDYYYYGLYSESPYYYFSWLIQDNLNNADLGYSYSPTKSSTTLGGVNSLTKLLLKDNQEFFYNFSKDAGDGYGELKDFMNMHDLFYYVMPILQQGSDFTELFNKYYGIEMYEEIPIKVAPSGNIRFTDEGTTIEVGGTANDDNAEISEDYTTDSSDASSDVEVTYYTWAEFYNTYKDKWSDELMFKFWHNCQVVNVLQCYSAWTDTMNDCSYAKSEKIQVGGKSFVVEHPLDPTSYFTIEDGVITAGRYMVFSRSEMKYYGLTDANLTSVERKIIAIQDKVYSDCISLMNYSNFDDDVLISALAMDMLFAFNTEFSQNNITSDSHVLYPTGYEMKAFTYDSYMRLILSEATGEDLMTEASDDKLITETDTNGSIYERVLKNTSIFFALFLLILDIIVTYIIPALRLLFLIMIFLLSIVVIVGEAVKLEFNIIRVVFKSLLAPLLSFGAITIGLSWITSLFMSNGYDDIVKGSTTISLGDPTMTVIIMIGLNVVVVVLYWKILTTTFKNFKKFAEALVTNVGGTVAGAMSKTLGALATGGLVGGLAASTLSKLRGIEKGVNNGGLLNKFSTAKQRGADNTDGSPKVGSDSSGLQAKESANNANTDNNAEEKQRSYKDIMSSGAQKIKNGASDMKDTMTSKASEIKEKGMAFKNNRARIKAENRQSNLDKAKDVQYGVAKKSLSNKTNVLDNYAAWKARGVEKAGGRKHFVSYNTAMGAKKIGNKAVTGVRTKASEGANAVKRRSDVFLAERRAKQDLRRMNRQAVRQDIGGKFSRSRAVQGARRVSSTVVNNSRKFSSAVAKKGRNGVNSVKYAYNMTSYKRT